MFVGFAGFVLGNYAGGYNVWRFFLKQDPLPESSPVLPLVCDLTCRLAGQEVVFLS